ncbi:hypothetical protein PTSG_08201 [Salpingoeca rosetta]|uniref:tRNA methyltransferase 10 homolog B n=1 Tax=Salpingoeca rosetta (strain ATCC 50818 / BSB-021) TaxID=946362 RepID=F2UIA4_SALR5|nr:uncharacterized protein PTSG_08201 [Salpingoeca rosetta]EGD76853.1 hypothetical protein PTSG_08201 [Salpingoeca rosetta]|eukprot:XP_004991225.1 hypothetical protein PTSG_08201 [Salpingoeca rosetta]
MCSKPYGVQLAFSPRLYAKHLVNEDLYREQHMVTCDDDLPLVTMAAPTCKALCLDLTWNSKRAINGQYGACLLQQRDLVGDMLTAATQQGHKVFAGVRVTDETQDVEGLVRMVEKSGCVGIVVDTRTTEETAAICNWDVVARIKALTALPVLAHASLNSPNEIQPFLKHTGADAVVATTELLFQPTLFSLESTTATTPSSSTATPSAVSSLDLAARYLQLFRQHMAFPFFARWHLCHLLHSTLLHMPDIFDDVHNANTPAALERVLEEIKTKAAAAALGADVNACRICPPLAYHSAPDTASILRYEGDVDQAAAARSWASDLVAAGVLPSNHVDMHKRLEYDPNCGHERKLNQLAKRKLKRIGFQKQQKEEKAKQRKQRRRAAREAGAEDQAEKKAKTEQVEKKTKQEQREERRARVLAAMQSPTAIRVAIDMGLGDAMNRKEIVKLSDQIRRLYGANLRAQHPCHLHLTSLDPNGLPYRLCKQRNVGFDDYLATMTDKTHIHHFDPSEIVFLTPDSPNVLVDLVPSKTYVFGGLVDESIQKNFTLNRAQKAGIVTARLPILEFSNAKATKYAPVLSINQVFDAFLKVIHGEGWREGLRAAVPERKGFALYSEEKINATVQHMKEQSVDGVYMQATSYDDNNNDKADGGGVDVVDAKTPAPAVANATNQQDAEQLAAPMDEGETKGEHSEETAPAPAAA